MVIHKAVNLLRTNTRPIIIATWIGIIVNALLTVLKGVGGFLSGSRALLADALHSASDIAGSIVVLFGVKIANKPPEDRKSTRLNSSHVAISYAVFCLKIEILISSCAS